MSIKNWKTPRFIISFEGEDLKKDEHCAGETIKGIVVLQILQIPLIVNGVYITLRDSKTKHNLATENLSICIHEMTSCNLPMSHRQRHSHTLRQGSYNLPFQFRMTQTRKVYIEVRVDGDYDKKWHKSKTRLELGLADEDDQTFYSPGFVHTSCLDGKCNLV